MHSTTLTAFRQELYQSCFRRAADALFDLTDALLTDNAARSFVELSEATAFRRRWPSLYEALEDGRIEREALRRLFAASLPQQMRSTRLVLGLDTSSILRPDARTSPDRTFVHRSNLPADATPVAPGWHFSTVVVLPDQVSSWTYVLDTLRVPSSATPTTIGVRQLQALVPLLQAYAVPILLLLDRRYSNAAWVAASGHLPIGQLIRARADQVLYREPPPRTGKRGAPRKDGARFKGSDPSTWGEPEACWQGQDERGQPGTVRVWSRLHLRKARAVSITVVQVVREGAAGSKRDPREMWLWWLGEGRPPLEELPKLYARRYGQEHGYRFDKQDLLWAKPRLRQPEHFERWSDLVACVRNQLVLARSDCWAERRAWERRSRPATPRQVRRAMGRIIAQLGTPARAPKVRGKSPGRALGAVIKPAKRHEVVRKSPPKEKSVQT